MSQLMLDEKPPSKTAPMSAAMEGFITAEMVDGERREVTVTSVIDFPEQGEPEMVHIYRVPCALRTTEAPTTSDT